MDWKIENNRLTKEYKFKNQADLAAFFLRVAKISDENDHHPEFYIRPLKTVLQTQLPS